jgi:ribosomal protein S18 acetylase RimI-like enzyme
MDLVTRPATPADAPAIYRLVAACERAWDGRVETGLDGVVANLARPALDLARDTALVHDPAGELVGWGWVHLGRRAEVHVRPDHCGRGLGTRLLAWAQARSREVGSERVGQNVSDGNAAAGALLRAHGYQARATSWLLSTAALTAPPEVPEPPGGIAIRCFRPGDELATYRMVEDAFNEWQQRPRTYEEWAGQTIGRATFVPALSPLAFDGDRLVGAVLSLERPDSAEGYVERVAVHRDYRNRGVARALLRYAFRGFHQRGRPTCVLWTHSETGALSLYERVGMAIRASSTHLSKPLTETLTATELC